MTARDLSAILRGVAPTIRDYVAAQTAVAMAPILAKVEALASRDLRDGKDGAAGRDGINGKDAPAITVEQIRDVLRAQPDLFLAAATDYFGAHPIVNGNDGAPGERGEKGDPGERGLDGHDGRDADMAEIALLKSDVAVLRAELATVRASAATATTSVDATAVKSAVADAVAQLPLARDGRDGLSVSVADVAPLIVAEVGKAIAAMPIAKDGEPGKSVDIEDVKPFIAAHVDQTLATWPHPKDGQSVTIADVEPLIAAHVERAVARIPAPKDGVGVAGAFIDRAGALVLTLSDGTAKTLGCVVGSVDPADVVRAVNDHLATWDRPTNGKDGRDGTLENLKILYDGERTITLCFKNGDPIDGGVMRVPITIYRGVWEDGRKYERGDQVTWAGSQWTAKRDTANKPDEHSADPDWQLSVKRGRDGKEGKIGPVGATGPRGLQGPQGPRWS